MISISLLYVLWYFALFAITFHYTSSKIKHAKHLLCTLYYCAKYYDERICVCVCVSVSAKISPKPQARFLPNILCMLPTVELCPPLAG